VKIEKLFVIALPLIGAIGYLYLKVRNKVIVLYFPNPEYPEGEAIDRQASYIIARKAEVAGLPVEVHKYKEGLPLSYYMQRAALVITVGGPKVNPFYYSITDKELSAGNRIVVERKGRVAVVAGYTAEDTLKAAKIVSIGVVK